MTFKDEMKQRIRERVLEAYPEETARLKEILEKAYQKDTVTSIQLYLTSEEMEVISALGYDYGNAVRKRKLEVGGITQTYYYVSIKLY